MRQQLQTSEIDAELTSLTSALEYQLDLRDSLIGLVYPSTTTQNYINVIFELSYRAGGIIMQQQRSCATSYSTKEIRWKTTQRFDSTTD